MSKPATNYIGATDEGIVDLIHNWKEERIHHAEMMAAIDADIANFQAELARRQLEAFWARNPGLRLEVGDRLLVTEEALQNMPPGNKRYYAVGQTVIASEPQYDEQYSSYDLMRFHPVADDLHGYSSSVSLDVARRMSVAWLQLQEGAVE